jgi:hypothetical protein
MDDPWVVDVQIADHIAFVAGVAPGRRTER